ncbi:MAG: hypothetical protein ACSLEN_00230 [Candidatus Malihini olakiniferum]
MMDTIHMVVTAAVTIAAIIAISLVAKKSCQIHDRKNISGYDLCYYAVNQAGDYSGY